MTYVIEVKTAWKGVTDPERLDYSIDNIQGTETSDWEEVLSIEDIDAFEVRPAVIVTNSGENILCVGQAEAQEPVDPEDPDEPVVLNDPVGYAVILPGT